MPKFILKFTAEKPLTWDEVVATKKTMLRRQKKNVMYFVI